MDAITWSKWGTGGCAPNDAYGSWDWTCGGCRERISVHGTRYDWLAQLVGAHVCIPAVRLGWLGEWKPRTKEAAA